MIDNALIEKNRLLLETEQDNLEKLLSRVSRAAHGGTGLAAKYSDMGNQEDENAAEVVEYETNIAEEHDLEEKLRKVRAALARIAAGTYGVCQRGGEDLSADRLVAAPEAENCVEHEEA